MNLAFFRLSAFDEQVLKECPTMQYGASFIKYISYFQIVISFATGWFSLSLLNFLNSILNLILALFFSFVHILIIKLVDNWLHKHRKWSTILGIIFFVLIIAFLQTIFIANHLFKTELEINTILENQTISEYWKDRWQYYLKKPFYILSFKNKIVSSMSVALFIIFSFIGILPFILTFFYRKSKYYFTQKLIENFKTEYEQISTK